MYYSYKLSKIRKKKKKVYKPNMLHTHATCATIQGCGPDS